MSDAPCNWSADTSCCAAFWTTVPVELQASAVAWASKILWSLSGRRLGDCPIVVRPCANWVGPTYRTYGVWSDGYYSGLATTMWLPYVDIGGNWRNCGCSGMCICEPTSAAWLPGPVSAITSVKVNNVVVDPANYRVDIGHDGKYWLVAENGQIWPECQNFDHPATSADSTFVVAYTRGPALSADAKAMVGLMACEYAKLCMGLPCALSAAATTISRDGVTYEVLTAEDLIQKGFTPIAQVNQWIYAVNPHGLHERPRIWSPDDDVARVTVIP